MDNKQVNDAITIGDEVRSLVETTTWQNYIEPVFDAMIMDVLGGKINGRWDNGALGDKELEEKKLRELQAYKAGIVSIHQAIYKFIDDADEARILLKREAERVIDSENEYELGEYDVDA